jgi:hypothetical protein
VWPDFSGPWREGPKGREGRKGRKNDEIWREDEEKIRPNPTKSEQIQDFCLFWEKRGWILVFVEI